MGLDCRRVVNQIRRTVVRRGTTAGEVAGSVGARVPVLVRGFEDTGSDRINGAVAVSFFERPARVAA